MTRAPEAIDPTAPGSVDVVHKMLAEKDAEIEQLRGKLAIAETALEAWDARMKKAEADSTVLSKRIAQTRIALRETIRRD